MKELTYALCLITCVLTIVSVRALAVAEQNRKRIDEIIEHQNRMTIMVEKGKCLITELLRDVKALKGGSTWMFTVPCSKDCKEGGLK